MEILSDPQPPKPVTTDNMEVDIVERIGSADDKLEDFDDPNATECSSSFSDTMSGTEDGSRLSDAEVESRFCLDNGIGSNLFDGFDSLFRTKKKKLTTHWRSYIHSLMWRCKWTELRIKEVQSQALAYERELASIDQRKKLNLEKGTLEGNTRSLPFCGQSNREKVMKRRKRNRLEDKVDLSSYMSRHNLFSYYESKRSDLDGATVDDDFGLQVFPADAKSNEDLDVNYPWASNESTDDQSTVEKLLLDIETTQCRVKKLKIQLDELSTVHAGKFSSMESLLVQSDLPNSCARSPPLSPRDGDKMLTGALDTPPCHISNCDIVDLVMPENEVSIDGMATPPEIIESTMGILTSAEDAHLDQPQIGDSCLNMEDELKLNDFDNVGGVHIEEPQEDPKEEVEITVPPSVPSYKPEPNQETNVAQEQSVLKSCLASDFHVPKNKRKPVQRKACLGSWKAGKISRQTR